MKAYPSYHNVRFSQHLNNVCIAVLNNLDGALQHWTIIESDTSTDNYKMKETLCVIMDPKNQNLCDQCTALNLKMQAVV